MKFDKAVSVFLLFLALLIAGFDGVSQVIGQVSYPILAMGFFAGLLVSIIESFKSIFIIRESVESTMESMRSMPQITIVSDGNEQIIQRAASWMESIKKGLTKTMGKAMLVFYKIADFGVKAIAGLCGLIYLAFPMFELLGLWIILSTVFLLVVFKFSSLFARFLPFAGSRSERSKKTLAGFGLLSLSAWILSSVSLWAFFRAFGIQVELVGLFFLTALFATLSLTPFTFDGIGVIEFVGMGAFSVLGVPIAVSLLCLLAWEVSKLVGDFLVTILPEQSITKEDLSKYA